MRIIIDGKKLCGAAMPRILTDFRRELIGRTIKGVGYLQYEAGEAQVWPCLLLDNEAVIVVQCDDAGNGPGVLRLVTEKEEFTLCQTAAKE